jgi:hypothetical protein
MVLLFKLLFLASTVTGFTTFVKTKSLSRSILKFSTETSNEDAEAALIKRINSEVLAESGVELDQLINPSKVVNLEKELINLGLDLNNAKTTIEIDNIQAKINKNKEKLSVEKRAVMRKWLKNLFVGQSVLATVASLLMVYNAIPNVKLPLAIQVLGFWMWWLFIIPSLRFYF